MQDRPKTITELLEAWPQLESVEIDEGWVELVDTLMRFVHPYISFIAKIKSKYGSLRFYVNVSGTPLEMRLAEAAIVAAECASERICEVCGAPGKIRSGGWVITLCDEHHNETKRTERDG